MGLTELHDRRLQGALAFDVDQEAARRPGRALQLLLKSLGSAVGSITEPLSLECGPTTLKRVSSMGSSQRSSSDLQKSLTYFKLPRMPCDAEMRR